MTPEETIYQAARADGMPYFLSTLLVAQAKHETGNFTHRFFTTGKNAFGYSYYSGSKWQLPTPGSNADNGQPIAQYASVQNSVHEITDWIKRRQNEGKFPKDLNTITTADQYAQLLKNAGYYGAPLSVYANALNEWLRKMGAVAGDLAPMLFLAALAFIVYSNRRKK